MPKILRIYRILFLLFLTTYALGQGEQVTIENADNQIIETKSEPAVQYLNGNVRAYHNGSYIFCDTAVLKGNELYAIGNVSILQNDTVRIFSDTLIYLADSSLAIFKKEVILENGNDRLFTSYLEYNLSTKIAHYFNKAILNNGKDTLKSLRGRYDAGLKEAWFYEKVSVDGANFMLRSDSLRYLTEQRHAFWNSPCLIERDKARMYSERGHYDLINKFGEFGINAQYIEGDTISFADDIVYDGTQEYIKLMGNAHYSTPKEYALADTIISDIKNDITTLIGDAIFLSDSMTAEGDKLRFDKSNDFLEMQGRSKYTDGTLFVEAEHLKFDKKSENGLAVGDVIWEDTSAHTIILCDSLIYKGSESYFKAMGYDKRPLFVNEMDEDTLWLAADTLYSYREIIFKDSVRFDTIFESNPRFEAVMHKNDSLRKSKIPIEINASLAIDTSGVLQKIIDTTAVTSSDYEVIDSNLIGMPEMGKELVKDIVSVTAPIEPKPSTINSISSDSLLVKIDIGIPIEPLDKVAVDSIEDKAYEGFIQLDSFKRTYILDSVFIASIPIDTVQYLIGDNKVKVYKEDMQLISDSLTYNDKDSLFTFEGDPVMWSDTTQLKGDTINLLLKNGGVHSLKIIDNAIVINSTDLMFFSQIGGKIIDGYFKEKKLNEMKVNGNAQSVYYMIDESGGYIGVNVTECSFINFYFKDQKINDIRFYAEPNSIIHPMKTTDHESIKLGKFDWQFDQKPISQKDLIIWSHDLIKENVIDENKNGVESSDEERLQMIEDKD